MTEHTNQSDQYSFRSPLLMSRDASSLLVIDVQQKLVPLIRGHDQMVWNVRRLIRGAKILGVPVHCTEQYPKGLGSTIPEIAELVSADEEKLLFSCRDCKSIDEQLKDQRRNQIALCGIETHVCIQQTALDFVAMGYDVWVPIDAIGARFAIDHETALRRLEQAGVVLTTTESALFEWCETADTPEFKQISAMVREPSTVTNP